MPNRPKKTLILTLVTLLFAAHTAFADPLDEAKGTGLVGERADGYLGIVNSDAGADIVQLVKDVNSKRRAEYQRIASANNLTVEQVQALAGKKAISKTQAGHWVMANGGWARK